MVFCFHKCTPVVQRDARSTFAMSFVFVVCRPPSTRALLCSECSARLVDVLYLYIVVLFQISTTQNLRCRVNYYTPIWQATRRASQVLIPLGAVSSVACALARWLGLAYLFTNLCTLRRSYPSSRIHASRSTSHQPPTKRPIDTRRARALARPISRVSRCIVN